jgi:hypothetical protein
MKIKPLTRTKNILVQELEDEVLVYDLNVNRAFSLNNTSALVWKLCDGNSTVPEICEKMSLKLKKSVSEDVVWLALDQFIGDGLLENGDDLGDHFAGQSRREVIRKVGIASMVALPLVSSIVAPMASAAQSGAPPAPACTPGCFQNAPTGPNTNACTGCTQPADFVRWSSTDGSCTGVIQASFPNINCSGNNLTAGSDLQRL